MTADQFNEKYKDFLEEGHYGLSFNLPEFTLWLDKKFEQFILKPGFSYSQIKVKFGMGRFYCEGITNEEIDEIEQHLKHCYNETYKPQ